jgi:hypothetical protein
LSHVAFATTPPKARSQNRTGNLLITNQPLFQLSYSGKRPARRSRRRPFLHGRFVLLASLSSDLRHTSLVNLGLPSASPSLAPELPARALDLTFVMGILQDDQGQRVGNLLSGASEGLVVHTGGSMPIAPPTSPTAASVSLVCRFGPGHPGWPPDAQASSSS